MTILIILALLGVVAVYAVFFLLFKLVWILMKKDTNKWPLIWAGVSTVLFGIVLGGAAAWSVYKVVSPFRGMIERYSANPEPVYGQHVYTDPIYRFQLTALNGMDFSEWVEFDDLDAKIGVDMNTFKKVSSAEEKQAIDAAFTGAILLRQDEVDEGHPLQPLREALISAENSRKSLEILSQEDFTVDGYPAMFVTARARSNSGKQMFFAMSAIADSYQQVFYVIAFSADTPEASANALQLARSLQLENGSPLPAPATEAPAAEGK